MATASSSSKVANDPSEDVDIPLARLAISTTRGGKDDASRDRSAGGAEKKTSEAGLTRRHRVSEKNDPWKTLSDRVNEEISRQIYDELDAQIMAELEKCHEEQSKRLDEELDRQLQEQLDAMLEANLASELEEDEQDMYDFYSEDEGDYSSDYEEEHLQKLPWSEGGEGGIRSLGLTDFAAVDHENARSHQDLGSTFGAQKYSEDELQKMVDNLDGEGGVRLPGPGAWGRGRWRPHTQGDTQGDDGDDGDSSP